MILIKSMEKPKSCPDCRLKDNYYKECNVTHRKIKSWLDNHEKTPEWCPLVEVTQYGPEGTLYKETNK